MQHMPTHLKFTPTKSFDAAKLLVQQISHLKVREVCCTKRNGTGNGKWKENKEQNEVTLSLVPVCKVSN